MKNEQERFQRFVDLVSNLTEFDLANRQIIETLTANYKSNDLISFIESWGDLDFPLEDGVRVVGFIENQATQLMSSKSEVRKLCKLVLVFDDQEALHLQFWAREAPEMVGRNRHESPIALYHTKVNVPGVEGFTPFKYYDAIMYLIRKIVPHDTKLLLYVRQKDSRQMLEVGYKPEDIPLTKVFKRAGWKYLSYHNHQNAKDDLRKHRLTVQT